MNRSLIMLSAFVVLTGCGKHSGKKSNANLFDSTLTQEYLSVSKQAQQCVNKDSDFLSTIMNLNLISRGFSVRKEVDFVSMLQGNKLKDGASVSRTMYNEKTHYELSSDYQRVTVTQIALPEELELCPDDTDYKSGTVESAALNASYIINKTHHNFLNIVKDVDVKSIYVNVAPVISKSLVYERVKYTFYETDNAYYNPAEGSITLLPHSKAHKDAGGVNYWEVPMISSHEYGHHLFQSIYQEDYSSHVTAKCFESAKKLTQLQQSIQEDSEDTKRTVTNANVLLSYNEAFADLIAYYSLDKEEGSVAGVKCLEVNRDVGKNYFYFGIPKKYSSDALETFFSNKKEKDLGLGCNYPSFQDEHTLGAVFAYSADQILKMLATTNEEKISALVDWVKYLKSEKDSGFYYKTPKSYLKDTFKTFVTMSVAKFKKPYDYTLCAKVESLYPGLDLAECKFW